MQLNKLVWLFVLVIIFLPFLVEAQDLSSSNKHSSSVTCEKNWMINIDSAADETTFRDFGEKYCDCVTSQHSGLTMNSEKIQAMCKARTALYLTMDNIAAEEGLLNVTEDKVKASCTEIWSVVNHTMDTANKQNAAKLCVCAAPKLNALTKKKDNYTDREWYANINEIAAGC